MNPTEDQIRAILYEFMHPERIQTSQMFKNIVFRIARGAKLHSIIEDLLTVIEDQRKELEERPSPRYVSIDMSEEEKRAIEYVEMERRVMSELCGIPTSPFEGKDVSLMAQVADDEYHRLMKALYP